MSAPLSRNTLFLLASLLVLALGLRLYRVGTYGIFFDGKSTQLISQSVVLEGSNQKDVFSKPYFTPAEYWKPKTINDFIDANIRGDIGNSPAYYAVEPNHIILVKGNSGEKTTIFDFRGATYPYID